MNATLRCVELEELDSTKTRDFSLLFKSKYSFLMLFKRKKLENVIYYVA